MLKYEELSEGGKEVIQMTKVRFMDAFDSDNFGPFLNNFHRIDDDRLVALLDMGLGQLMMLLSHRVYFDVSNYPYKQPLFRQAAILALTIEIITHLMRSYVEIPDTTRVNAPDVVRRDYLTRWRDILNEYKDQLKNMAKKLNADLYAEGMESGSYQSVLIDWPSSSFGYIPGYAEKEWYGYGWL